MRVRPLARAFLARRPAANNTDGLDVLVHDVMAAMTTSPSSSCALAFGPVSPATADDTGVGWAKPSLRALSNSLAAAERVTRSCGRFGPASDGSTLFMS